MYDYRRFRGVQSLSNSFVFGVRQTPDVGMLDGHFILSCEHYMKKSEMVLCKSETLLL